MGFAYGSRNSLARRQLCPTRWTVPKPASYRLSTKPIAPRPSRPSLSTKAPCSLPALRFGEHDQPRDRVLAPPVVISASAKPRAGDEGREAERAARTGPSTTKPRRLPAGAPVNHEAHLSWWTTLFGSPCATLFITVLFLPQLTENLQYQRVIKDQAVPDEAEAASRYISLAIGRHKGLVCTKPG